MVDKKPTTGGTVTYENHPPRNRTAKAVMIDDTSTLAPIDCQAWRARLSIWQRDGQGQERAGTKTKESRDKDKREKGCPFDGRTDGQRQGR